MTLLISFAVPIEDEGEEGYSAPQGGQPSYVLSKQKSDPSNQKLYTDSVRSVLLLFTAITPISDLRA